MADSSWQPFENGSTLGQTGSEAGTIVRDEEHALGARISCRARHLCCPLRHHLRHLRLDAAHARFFGSQEEAETQYDAMKQALAALLEAAEKTAESDGGRQVLMEGVSSFVEMFP